MPAWIVTGGSGFLGRHLLDRLGPVAPGGAEVVAVGRRPPRGWAGRFVAADFDDRDAVARAVDRVRPEVMFHLAGRTPPGTADEFERANVGATVAWLDALRAAGRAVRFVLAGSAAELGPIPLDALPVGEDWPCDPADAYGLTKLCATVAAVSSRGTVQTVVARIFNPIGPGLPTAQALGRFARALAEGDGDLTLTVGDLDARRDFVDARDVADALIALAGRGRPGRLYHVGTGRSRRVGDGLDRLIALSGRRVVVQIDPGFARPAGPSDSRADIARIVAEVGWVPRIAWEQSLLDLWEAARAGPG